MRKYRLKAIPVNACRCCLVNTATHDHHRQPQSQNGGEEPENKVRVCLDCHSLYHAITNQRLASTSNARARNFATWLAHWPGTEMELCGKKRGPDPFALAPEFVQEEWALASTMGETGDLSGGCLSNIEPVKEMYPIRDHLKKGAE